VKDSALYPIFFIAVIAGVFAFVVSALNAATAKRVHDEEEHQLHSHIFTALSMTPPTSPAEFTRLWNASVREKTDAKGRHYYVRVDTEGNPTAYALPFTSPGFWGPIEGIMGFDASGERIAGITFTKNQETPGLGARITEQWFTDQFKGKPTSPPESGGDTLKFVDEAPSGAHEVQAITGATETSRRLGKYLNKFVPEAVNSPIFAGAPADAAKGGGQ